MTSMVRIISSAGLLNALEVAGKKIEDVKIVVSGAGAAAIMCTKLYVALGAKLENILMLDSKGVITSDRPNLTEEKKFFATERRDAHTLEEAMKGADVFLGLSKGNVVSQDMIRSMAENPIVFACANPVPEISYEDAMAARPDVLMSTGRSDYPNQINNVIGFPYIFRGALDVNASAINEEMKIAAVHAIADLAKQPVPDVVNQVYKVNNLTFGLTISFRNLSTHASSLRFPLLLQRQPWTQEWHAPLSLTGRNTSVTCAARWDRRQMSHSHFTRPHASIRSAWCSPKDSTRQ